MGEKENMSEEFGSWDESNETDQEISGPKALRDLVARQKADLKAINDQMDALKNRVREAELSKVFTAKNLPEKAMKLFPKDVEPTDEAINGWVSEYGDLFGVGKQEATTTVEQPAQIAQPAQPDMQTQFQQMSAVTMGAQAATGTALDELNKALANPNLVDDMSFEDYKKLLARANGRV